LAQSGVATFVKRGYSETKGRPTAARDLGNLALGLVAGRAALLPAAGIETAFSHMLPCRPYLDPDAESL
jgi:hypothetical protein